VLVTATLTPPAVPARHLTAVRDPLVDLVERTAMGFEPAFDEFYSVTRSRVYNQVNRVVQNPSLADEVTQEVFVELWTQAHRYDHTMGSVMAWVLTIGRRRAIDRVRHEEGSHRHDTRYAEDHPSQEVDVFDSVSRVIDAEHLRVALCDLTDRQRQAVELAYLDGYANLEIADLLGIPLATTKTRIRDGLTRLQTTMHDQSWLAPHDADIGAPGFRRRTQSAR